MNVLAIDTSSAFATVAVTRAGILHAEVGARFERKKGEALLEQVGQALSSSDLEAGDLDLIAVGLGPGGFTSLRVGLATAKGLGLARRTAIVGVSSLAVVARGMAGEEGVAAPVVDAYRGEVFTAAYRFGPGGTEELLEPVHASPEEARRQLEEAIGDAAYVTGGDGYPKHPDALAPLLEGKGARAARLLEVPRAALLALLGEEAFNAEGPSDLATLEPLYVRPSDAKLPARPLRRA